MENPTAYRIALMSRSPSPGSDADDEATPSPSPTMTRKSSKPTSLASQASRSERFLPRVSGSWRRSKFPSNPVGCCSQGEAPHPDERGHSDEKAKEEPPAGSSGLPDRLSGAEQKGYEKMLRICRQLREARESRGTSANGDIRKACRWLLDREGVPANLRAVAWAQLLREDMQDSESEGEEENGAIGPDRTSVDAGRGKRLCRAVDSWDDKKVEDNEEKERGRKRTVDEEDEERWRRATTSCDELDSPRLCAEDDGRQRSISPATDDMVQVEAAMEPRSCSSLSERHGRRSVRIVAEEEETKDKLDRQDALVDERMNELLARQKARTDESLQALERLVLGAPTVERCTCKVMCHCIYGTDVRQPNTSVDGVTARPAAAALPPTNNEVLGLPGDMFREARLDLGWFDKKHASHGKIPEGKRDSIRPDELPRPPNT